MIMNERVEAGAQARFQPPQCPTCGAPTKDGIYRNDALIEETGKRVAAEVELAKLKAKK